MSTEINLDLELPVFSSQLEKILPHRYPFLLIDRWLEVSGGSVENRTGRKVKALKNLTNNEAFFQGHFPGNPIMPGVLSLEALAQTSALCAYIPLADKNYEFYIVSADKVRFRRQIVPGDQLELEVEVLKDRKRMILFQGKAFVDGELATEAQFMAQVLVKDKKVN
ncbi:MAG: 3-hydroxyacyl-ACP dehydratase FabZ [Bdellovibrionota bacterium]|nr:3-hydroxyacyl-[acyl-carrier-protein] dehydratase FabZ [Pseudobdellovibrionaceae bacterium]|tara:strand:+ start:14083 stop:14580 length:498 start_codon:yes stop_codon:yes gene_type:complete